MSSTPASRAGARRPKYYDLSLAHLPPPGLGSQECFSRIATLAGRPGVKLILLACTWAYAHHFFAGIRYLFLDMHMGIAKQPARTSAVIVLVLGVLTTIVVGWRIW